MSERPSYHNRGGTGCLIHNGITDAFHFLYRENNILRHDRWTPDAIHNGSVRFYRFVDPPSYYTRYPFATVNDDAVLIQFALIEDEAALEEIRRSGDLGVQRTVLLEASEPPDADLHFRSQRDSINNIDNIVYSPLSTLIEIANNPLYNRIIDTFIRPPPLIIPLYNPITQSTIQVQRRVADVMIAEAIRSGTTCPISMEVLTASTAVCVAPCYHVFDRASITHWLESNDTCPQCRVPCTTN